MPVSHQSFGQCHGHIQISKRQLRLDHPELGQMATGVRTFGAEGGTKGVDALHPHGERLGGQLPRHGQVGGTVEEGAIGLDFESGSGSFCIIGRQDGRGHPHTFLVG